MFKRLTLAVATLATAGLCMAGAATAANAATPASSYGCVNHEFGYCGTQQFALIGSGDLVMAVAPGTVVPGVTKIVVEPRSDSPSQDFYTENYNGIGNSKVFEYAPNGRRSGLCVADSNASVGHGLVLNPCNYGVGQTFYPTQDPNNSSEYSWNSGRSTTLVIADNGNGGPGNQLKMEIYGGFDSQEMNFLSET
jgi:hypothetical protein